MTREVPVTQARAELAELVSRVGYSGERVLLTRHGKALAALVPVADLEILDRRPAEIGFSLPLPAETGDEHIDLPDLPDRPDQADRPGGPLRVAAEHRTPREPRRRR